MTLITDPSAGKQISERLVAGIPRYHHRQSQSQHRLNSRYPDIPPWILDAVKAHTIGNIVQGFCVKIMFAAFSPLASAASTVPMAGPS